MDELSAQVLLSARRNRLFEPGTQVVVGVSGGADSLCLAHLLLEMRDDLGIMLHVAHLNHGLRGADAAADEAFVATQAKAWGVPFHTGHAKLLSKGSGLEEAARLARYAFLARVAAEAGAGTIAVGHTADDQAETVLMHFLRGSGTAGLQGMRPRVRPDVGGDDFWLVRPLLGCSHAQVEKYCREHGLNPRIDFSNEDRSLLRNRVRLELMPLLSSYNPAIRRVLVHTAEVMAGDNELVHTAVLRTWPRLATLAPPGQVCLDREQWRGLSIGLQRACLRHAVLRLRGDLRHVDWDPIESAIRLAREGTTGKRVILPGGLVMVVSYGCLRLGPADGVPPLSVPQLARPITLAAPGETEIDGWCVRVKSLGRAELSNAFRNNPDPWAAWLDAEATGDCLLLRPRLPGERFRPLGLSGHTTSVKELMIDAKVPRAARAAWPIVAGRNGIAWICGLKVDDAAAITEATHRAWHICFERRHG